MYIYIFIYIYLCLNIYIHVYIYTWTFQRMPWMVPLQGVNFSMFFFGLSGTPWKVHRYILCLFFPRPWCYFWHLCCRWRPKPLRWRTEWHCKGTGIQYRKRAEGIWIWEEYDVDVVLIELHILWKYEHMSRRLKSPSSSYIFERFSLQTCASWPVKRYSELPKTITWELVHLWKNCMKCIVGSMKLHDVISLSLKLLTVCLRTVNFKCQSKRMLSDVLWALQALMFWSFFWNLHRIER